MEKRWRYSITDLEHFFSLSKTTQYRRLVYVYHDIPENYVDFQVREKFTAFQQDAPRKTIFYKIFFDKLTKAEKDEQLRLARLKDKPRPRPSRFNLISCPESEYRHPKTGQRLYFDARRNGYCETDTGGGRFYTKSQLEELFKKYDKPNQKNLLIIHQRMILILWFFMQNL